MRITGFVSSNQPRLDLELKMSSRQNQECAPQTL